MANKKTARLGAVLKQLSDEYGGYLDYDLPEAIDEVNRAWHKANETLAAATWPIVASGRVPMEVRFHHAAKVNIGLRRIYRGQATLWYKAAFWGFEKWREYTYGKYWDKKLDELISQSVDEDWDDETHTSRSEELDQEEEGWRCDYYEQRRLFLHWFTLLGYTYDEAWKVHEDWSHYVNE
ncbi:MAG: hypothetical protein ACE5IA_03020 [Dehalococcoidia bacterium]